MTAVGRRELGGAADLARELAESREREAALAAVLGVMRRAPGELTTVLEAVPAVAPRAHDLAHLVATQRVGQAVAQVHGNAQGTLVKALPVAFDSALNELLMVGSLVAFAGAALGLLLVRSQDFAHGAEAAAEPAPAG